MYDIYIKGEGKEIKKQIEDLKEMKKLLEGFKSTDEVKIKRMEKKYEIINKQK